MCHKTYPKTQNIFRALTPKQPGLIHLPAMQSGQQQGTTHPTLNWCICLHPSNSSQRDHSLDFEQRLSLSVNLMPLLPKTLHCAPLKGSQLCPSWSENPPTCNENNFKLLSFPSLLVSDEGGKVGGTAGVLCVGHSQLHDASIQGTAQQVALQGEYTEEQAKNTKRKRGKTPRLENECLYLLTAWGWAWEKEKALV